MEIVKNSDYRISIEDMGNDGEGIGHIDGLTVFVKDTVIGDVAIVKIIKLKKNIAYGKLVELIKPSEFRVQPVCTISNKCGGCTMQHMDYKKQLEYKWNKVANCLKRIGGIDDPRDIMECPAYGMENPYNYRNKAQFPVGRDKDGNVVIGFYAGRTHSIIDTKTCAIGAKVNDDIIEIVREFIEKYNITTYNEETGNGLFRHILIRVGFATNEIMVCFILNGERIPHCSELIESLANINGMTSISINVNMEKTNRILGDKCITLWGQDYITDYIGDVKYRISPQSFYQVNPAQTKVMYDKALSYADLSGNEVVWDMYCGIGTISLFLAKKAKKVYGVEIVPQAIVDAKNNARINNITNVEFYTGKAEEVVPNIYKLAKDNTNCTTQDASYEAANADVVVVDPPRKGCDAVLLETIVKMNPKRIVYVSCDPATLARDVKILGDSAYTLRKVAVVDNFCHSRHVESVALLVKER